MSLELKILNYGTSGNILSNQMAILTRVEQSLDMVSGPPVSRLCKYLPAEVIFLGGVSPVQSVWFRLQFRSMMLRSEAAILKFVAHRPG
jgi:hypothetical protein